MATGGGRGQHDAVNQPNQMEKARYPMDGGLFYGRHSSLDRLEPLSISPKVQHSPPASCQTNIQRQIPQKYSHPRDLLPLSGDRRSFNIGSDDVDNQRNVMSRIGNPCSGGGANGDALVEVA